MPNRLKIAISLAVFFGLIAAYGVYNFLRQQREATERLRQETRDVVVASKDIPIGTTLSADMVRSAPFPKASVPEGAFSKSEEVIGKVTRITTVTGEPLLATKLAEEGTALTVLLTPGHRAVAVRVDEIIGVSGFIVPNDRVDVIATVAAPIARGSSENRISKIVLQNKRVLSVAQNVEGKGKDGKAQLARSITLELTPEETEKLSLAAQEGSIILALRGLQDDKTVLTRGSTKSDLLALTSRRAPRAARRSPRSRVAPPAPDKYKVEVYSGNQRSVVEF